MKPTKSANYLNETTHPQKRKEPVSQHHQDRICNRHQTLDNRQLGVRIQRLVNEFMAVPNAQRERIIGVLRVFHLEVEILGVIQGVVVLGVENGGTGLESLTGDGDGGHAASHDAISFEDCDLTDCLVWGVAAEEVGDGGTADAAADYADSV